MTIEQDSAVSGKVIRSWETLVKEGKQAAGIQWTLGDLAIEVSNEARYGDGALRRFADEIGVQYNTLRNYEKVARAYPESARIRSISFTVYAELAHQPDRLELVGRLSILEVRALRAERYRNKQLPASEVDNYSRMAGYAAWRHRQGRIWLP